VEGVALRLFNVYGPGQALSNPYTGVMAIFAGRLLAGEPPLLYEDGRQLRDFVHVDDVVEAFLRAMAAPDAPGEVINIGSGGARTILELAARVAEAMGREDLTPQVLGRARAGDIRHCVADVGKARRLLGFAPRRTLDGSIDELVDWVSRQQVPRGVEAAQSELLRRGLVV
jgi:dTDP-L-rhamnose 4-epimerase